MLQMHNETHFRAGMFLFPDVNGIDTMYIVTKATFTIDGKVETAEEQVPILQADEYWDEPAESSLKYASEAHPAKSSTDVVLVGEAQTPDRREVDSLYATLAVAEREKTILVIGDRQWTGSLMMPFMTVPVPFETMPLVYERAYGGLHEIGGEEDRILYEERNPVGRGFVGERKRNELKGLPLPNLEDCEAPLDEPGNLQKPASFGHVAPSWEPRRSLAGTYDANWQRRRAPYLPEDFDPRFFNTAHPDLIFERYLEGGEPVELVNLSARGPIKFNLPKCEFQVRVTIADEDVPAQMNMETVLFEPEAKRFSMTWKGAVPCDKKALRIERVDIRLQSHKIDGDLR